MPYFQWSWTKYMDPPTDDPWHTTIQTMPPASALPRVLFMAHNCGSKNGREQRIRELIEHNMVDSISSCLTTMDVPASERTNKTDWMRRYMFYASFENGCVDDYITEKLWGAFAAGTLPVYYGAPNIMEHVPQHSIVNVRDFSSTADLVAHLQYLATNRTAYMEYHAWRTKALPVWFRHKYDISHVHSQCRVCRILHDKIKHHEMR